MIGHVPFVLDESYPLYQRVGGKDIPIASPFYGTATIRYDTRDNEMWEVESVELLANDDSGVVPVTGPMLDLIRYGIATHHADDVQELVNKAILEDGGTIHSDFEEHSTLKCLQQGI